AASAQGARRMYRIGTLVANAAPWPLKADILLTTRRGWGGGFVTKFLGPDWGGRVVRSAPPLWAYLVAGQSLFRKYSTLLVALVGGALIVNAAIEMYYSYGESREALIAVQREKAQGAAAVIEQFVREIEGQVGWFQQFQQEGKGVEERRFDFLRML